MISLNQYFLVTKDIKNNAYCYFYVRFATLIDRVGGMPWPKTGTTHNHALAQLGLLGKGCPIRGWLSVTLFNCLDRKGDIWLLFFWTRSSSVMDIRLDFMR